MSNSKACILDHNSLGELSNAFEYSADSVLKIQKAVEGYLNGVIEVMERQLEVIAQKHEEAKERLASAREAMESAREHLKGSMSDVDSFASAVASVAYGAVSATALGATGVLVAAAKADCEMAQRNCDKWEKNYETAKEVVSECKTYKSDWEHRDAFSFGGDFYLEMLGRQHTDHATEKLRKILGLVEKYSDVSISSHENQRINHVEALDKYEKREIIRDSETKVSREQIDEMNYHGATNATRVVKCNQCKRPLSICICRSTRSNIELIES